ncbi:MAG: tRNA glutamyl-Q(34) synthetase GluQRS [Pseudomonadota bacterium]
MPPRTRFAPSPNGPLHLGHALSALANARVAEGGECLLRIEDIDAGRSRPEHVASIHEDLGWLGVAFAGRSVKQSERMEAYRAALDRLDAMGLLYPCFATRGEIRVALDGRPDWPRDPDGAPVYPGLHKSLTREARESFARQGRRPALRLDMDAALRRVGRPLSWREDGAGPAGETGIVAADPAAWGDVILARRDVPTSYHLSVVVDDAEQGVTHVVRGRDLFHATAIHRLLQALLGLPEPVYLHHRLLLAEDGRKLSKSDGAPRLGALRERGVAPGAVVDALKGEPLAGPDGPVPTFPPEGSPARA